MTAVNPGRAPSGIVGVNKTRAGSGGATQRRGGVGHPDHRGAYGFARRLARGTDIVLDLLETECKPPRAELLATSTELDEWLRAGVDGPYDVSVDALMDAIERSGCDTRFVPEEFCPAVIDTP